MTRRLPTLTATATKLKNNQLLDYLNSGKNVYVHSSCRKRFTERKSVSSEMNKINTAKKVTASPLKSKLRKSENISFNWTENCFISTKQLSQNKSKQSQNMSAVISYETKLHIIDAIKNMRDESSRSLLLRINSLNDLRFVNVKYHRVCYTDILKQNSKPEKTIDPRIIKTDKAMGKIINYINEHPDYLFSLAELMNVVADDLPHLQTIKNRLHQYYGDDLVISSYRGLSTLLCLKEKHHDILNKSFGESNLDAKDENVRKIKEVTDLIRTDICKKYSEMTIILQVIKCFQRKI